MLLTLAIWGIVYVEDTNDKISIFGIVAVITAAFTSVITVSINHEKIKEREYEFYALKEKQKVYEHFYNSFFEILKQSKRRIPGLPKKAESETMLFKQGLMNWGSDRIIKEYIKYDNKLTTQESDFDILNDGNKFLKEIRKDMGFNDPHDLNLIDIILSADARIELRQK